MLGSAARPETSICTRTWVLLVLLAPVCQAPAPRADGVEPEAARDHRQPQLTARLVHGGGTTASTSSFAGSAVERPLIGRASVGEDHPWRGSSRALALTPLSRQDAFSPKAFNKSDGTPGQVAPGGTRR
jgi:hypothetical protein